MIHRLSSTLGGRPLFIEAGKLAKQSHGSVLVGYGDTRVLVTACSAQEPREGINFFPLTVEFAEKFYASGKIPGSFHKREGRPTQEATLSARMIDRPIRPLFPEGYSYETQIIVTVLSVDLEADVDVAAALGASAALHISDIPFSGPTAACRVGRIQGKYVINPHWEQIASQKTDMEIFVVGTKNAIMMVEGGAREVPENEILHGILTAHTEIKRMIELVEELRKLCGKPKRSFLPQVINAEMKTQVEAHAKNLIQEALHTQDKQTRYKLVEEAKKSTLEKLVPDSLQKEHPEKAKKQSQQVSTFFHDLQYRIMREMILKEKMRIDGRDRTSVRPIAVETGLLPRVHGSGLFTRGETQVLAAVTLGTSDDEQIIDTMFENSMRQFLFHYNFPPFSVGETGRIGGQSRREIGHGALAERSVKAVMPGYEKFPYTVRVVCETLESNGSSSMASVCSASLALMDAGIPVSQSVAGIAMGLIKEKDEVAILTDILGDEDHLGDMDFKVAGTKQGITGIQMDIKIEGVNEAIMAEALEQARQGRLHILKEMEKALESSRPELSKFAPRITTISVPVDKIRDVIGSGGKVIRDIIAQTGCKIDINDDGKIHVASNDSLASEKALKMIEEIVAKVEVGRVYKGTVRKVVEFGAFVNVLPNQDGLLHISEIAHTRVHRTSDHYKEGDELEVKVLEIDKFGKIRLSRKALLPIPEGAAEEQKKERLARASAIKPQQ
jgi:polyribonucleotide nucleotidyltransferase